MNEARAFSFLRTNRREAKPRSLGVTEIREYGVRALGSGIPGIAREKLSAAPIDQWRREKDQFVYETWIAKAKALAGPQ